MKSRSRTKRMMERQRMKSWMALKHERRLERDTGVQAKRKTVLLHRDSGFRFSVDLNSLFK